MSKLQRLLAWFRRLFTKRRASAKRRAPFNLCDFFPASYKDVDVKRANIDRSHGAKAFKHKKKRLMMAKASRRRNRRCA